MLGQLIEVGTVALSKFVDAVMHKKRVCRTYL